MPVARYTLILDDESKDMVRKALALHTKHAASYVDALFSDILHDALYNIEDGAVVHYYDEDA